MAVKQLMDMTHRQGVVMAFGDVFYLLALVFVGLAVLSLTFKRPPQLR